jgi:hypothetical protein
METQSRHQCLIYEGSPSKKLGILAAILIQKLQEGYRCLYLNSAPMVTGMGSTLAALNMDVASEIAKGSLILSTETVSPGGSFNSKEMLDKLEDAINQAVSEGYKGLWASGDMTWEFGPKKDFSQLMEYEYGLEALFRKRKEICGICQYHRDTLPPDAVRQSLVVHPRIVISETLSMINPHYLESSWPADLNTTHLMDQTIAGLGG